MYAHQCAHTYSVCHSFFSCQNGLILTNCQFTIHFIFMGCERRAYSIQVLLVIAKPATIENFDNRVTYRQNLITSDTVFICMKCATAR